MRALLLGDVSLDRPLTRRRRPPRGLSGALGGLLRRVSGRSSETSPRSNALTDALEPLAGQRLVRLIRLEPLPEGGVGSLLAVLGHRRFPLRLIVRKFFEETGGNPFFVEELFRHLNEEARLFDAGPVAPESHADVSTSRERARRDRPPSHSRQPDAARPDCCRR